MAVQLNQEFRDTIQKNRQILRSIVETIILCGRQNIVLCGHRDNGTDLEVQGAECNHGNFVEAAFTNFKKLYELCDFHASRDYHKDAVAMCDAFVEQQT